MTFKLIQNFVGIISPLAMNASLVIPALNEEDSLPQVLDAIDRDLLLEVILVDGGSHDRTVSIAESRGARIIHEPQPGYGRACASGSAHAPGRDHYLHGR